MVPGPKRYEAKKSMHQDANLFEDDPAMTGDELTTYYVGEPVTA